MYAMQGCIFTRRLSLPMRPRNIAEFGSMRPCIIAAFPERHDLLICRRREHPVTEARTNPSRVFPIRRAEVSSSRKRPRSTGPSAERHSESSSAVQGHILHVFTAHVWYAFVQFCVCNSLRDEGTTHVLVRTVWDVLSTYACDGLFLLSLCCWLWFNDLNVWYAIMVLTAINYQTTNPYILVYFKTKALL